jgi:hypothetical protein
MNMVGAPSGLRAVLSQAMVAVRKILGCGARTTLFITISL